LIIRAQQAEDLDSLLKLFNRSRTAAACFSEADYSISEFLKALEGESIFVAEIGEQIAGFVSLWQPTNFIHHLYIDPKHQGAGIGKALLGFCQEEFGLPLSLKCVQANIHACQFYEGLGWVTKSTGIGTDGSYNIYWLE
jgi:ribosomal protein S18 acetylase RimI-like enzyme